MKWMSDFRLELCVSTYQYSSVHSPYFPPIFNNSLHPHPFHPFISALVRYSVTHRRGQSGTAGINYGTCENINSIDVARWRTFDWQGVIKNSWSRRKHSIPRDGGGKRLVQICARHTDDGIRTLLMCLLASCGFWQTSQRCNSAAVRWQMARFLT